NRLPLHVAAGRKRSEYRRRAATSISSAPSDDPTAKLCGRGARALSRLCFLFAEPHVTVEAPSARGVCCVAPPGGSHDDSSNLCEAVGPGSARRRAAQQCPRL